MVTGQIERRSLTIKLISLILSLSCVSLFLLRDAYPSYKLNPITGKLDYYEVGGEGETQYGLINATLTSATGIKGYVRIPYAGTITKVTLLADQSGSIVVDIWKDTYANYPPTVADTITASAKPTLSTATKYEDSTLTGWAKTLTAGDVLAFNVDSSSTLTSVQILIEVTKS